MKVKSHYAFKCQECGQCCKHYQYVELFDRDIERLVKSGRSPEEFIHVSKGVAYLRHDAGKCVFLKESRCEVNKIKPAVCKLYPLSFESLRRGETMICIECPGAKLGGKSTFEFDKNVTKPRALDDNRVVKHKLAKDILENGAKRIEKGARPIDAFGEIAWLVENKKIYSTSTKSSKTKLPVHTNILLNLIAKNYAKTAKFKVPIKGKRDIKLEKKYMGDLILRRGDLMLSDIPIYAEVMMRAVEILAKPNGSRSALSTVRINKVKLHPLALKILKKSIY